MLAEPTLRPYSTPVSTVRTSGEHEAWSLAASASIEALWYFDIATDEVCLSPRALELLGYGQGDVPVDGTLVQRHVHSADVASLQRAVAQVVRGTLTHAEVELRVVTVRGALRRTIDRTGARREPAGQISHHGWS